VTENKGSENVASTLQEKNQLIAVQLIAVLEERLFDKDEVIEDLEEVLKEICKLKVNSGTVACRMKIIAHYALKKG